MRVVEPVFYLIPAIVLAPAAWLARRPALLLLTQSAVALVVAGPLMGLTVPRVGRERTDPARARVRVLTFNQQGKQARIADLIRLIDEQRVDIFCLQETVHDSALEAYLARGWYRNPARCVASRLPIVRQIGPPGPPYDDPKVDRMVVRSAAGEEFAFASVHGPSMRPGFESLRAGDLRGLVGTLDSRRASLTDLAPVLDRLGGIPVIVVGDFNTPADSSLFDPLRARFRVGFEEAGWGYGYTWPARLPGVGIDHVLASPDWTFTACWVGPDLGSDHRPLIAELVLKKRPKTRSGTPEFQAPEPVFERFIGLPASRRPAP